MDKRLEKKIIQAIQKAHKNAAIEISSDIQSHYETYIQQFYDHYTPYSYNRTLSIFMGSDGTMRTLSDITKMQLNGYISKSQSGIHVSAQNIVGDPYNADKEWVFNRVFYEGIHGFTPEEQEKWGEKNSMVRFGKTPAEPMNPSPEALMTQWFNKYNTEENIYGIVYKHIDNELSKIL